MRPTSSDDAVTHRPPAPSERVKPGAADPRLRALHGRRVIVADLDPQRAAMIVRALAAHGASAVAVARADADLRHAAALDPDVVIVDADDAAADCAPILRALRRHPRTRWAAVLPVARAALWPDCAQDPDLTTVARALGDLVLPAVELAVRAKGKLPHEVPLQLLGPGRMLRVLCGTHRPMRVELTAPNLHARIELADGKICSAHVRGVEQDGESSKAQALAAVLGLTRGRVRIEERGSSGLADWNVALETALATASAPRAVQAAAAPAAPEIAALEPAPQSPALAPPSFEIEVETCEPVSLRSPEIERSDEPTPLAVSTQVASTRASPASPGRLRAIARGAALAVLLSSAALLWFMRSSGPIAVETASPRVSTSRSSATHAPQPDERQPAVADAKAAPLPATVVAAADLTGDPLPAADAATDPSHAADPGEEIREPHGRRDDARSLVAQAERQRRSGQLEFAEASYVQALELVPRYPRAVAGLVRVYLQRKNGAAAVHWAEQLVEIQDRAAHQLLLGDAHALNGDAAAAERAWLLAKRHGSAAARARLRGR